MDTFQSVVEKAQEIVELLEGEAGCLTTPEDRKEAEAGIASLLHAECLLNSAVRNLYEDLRQ